MKEFVLRAENTTDEIALAGSKLQFGQTVDIHVKRPNRLRANAEGALANQQFFFDGKSVTQFNKDENVYATLEAPGTIEEALEYAQNAFDLNAPLSDLISRDAYKILTQNVLSGHYVGLHLVRGVQCHHLVFVQDDIDWQIWIENSHTPLPRKMVITSKWLAGGPGGRYVRPMPAYRRTARRVYRRHDRFRTGAYVYSLPSDCREEVVSGKTYYYCDGMYYQAYYQGNDLVYVEVGDPR